MHPLINYEKSLRKSYACPACGKPYHQEPRLWEHGRKDHVEYLGGVEHVEKDDQVRKKFRAEALESARQRAQTLGKAATTSSRQTPGDKAGGKDEAGEGVIHVGSSPEPHVRRGSDPDMVGDPKALDRKIDDIGHLSLDQKKPTGSRDKAVSISNTRKRGAEGDLEPPDLHTAGYTPDLRGGKSHRGKIRSGTDFDRLAPRSDDLEYTRGPITSNQPLWNPDVGITNNVKDLPRDKQHVRAKAPRRSRNSREMAPSNQRRYSPIKDVANSQPTPHFESSFMETSVGDKAGTYPGQPPSISRDPDDRGSASSPEAGFAEDDRPETLELEPEPELLLQPETRPISHEQLVVEVKGIYAGLVMVEAKCIDIDERQSVAAQEKDLAKRFELKNDQWQSLIALHKQLLHEHHDFFLASQHPSASPALSRLAAKYSMPARMWRHGIHAFLEVLRHRLPDSLEHMLAFIYIAYSMMALLYETVPAFEDTWIECLGDLGRYRMAIEDDEPKDREVWSNVAKFWYNKASDKNPSVGRLYHHLAILARPYTLEQLSLYARSLTCVIPFDSAKGSVMTLFNPVLHTNDSAQHRASSFETVFIKIHAMLFTIKASDPTQRVDAAIGELESHHLFEKYIIKAGSRFKEIGVYISVANIAALFEYGFARDGLSKSRLRLAYERAQSIKQEMANKHQHPNAASTNANDPASLPPSTGPPEADPGEPIGMNADSPPSVIVQPSRLTSIILGLCLKDPKNSSAYPLAHIYLAFIWSLIIVQQACKYFEQDVVFKTVEREIPWITLCMFLNTLAAEPCALTAKVRRPGFPKSTKEAGRPLPEDFLLRGQLYAQWYYPMNWFAAALMDDDERSLDLPSMMQSRIERILWLGHRIASVNRWIMYNKVSARFEVAEYILDLLPQTSTSSVQDQDSTMSEADTLDHSPRTLSLAGTSNYSTRVSSPASTIAPIQTPPLESTDLTVLGNDVTMTELHAEKGQINTSPNKIETP